MNVASGAKPKVRFYKVIGIAVLLMSIALVAMMFIAIVIFIISWLYSNTVNAKRLHQLQSDDLLHCQVAQITPWQAEDSNEVGTIHGIGFGGTAPTTVARDFYLSSANPSSVMSTLLACAQKSGWKVTVLPGANEQDAPSVTGVKTFPAGWQATLDMGVDLHTPFASQPIVQIVISTDPV